MLVLLLLVHYSYFCYRIRLLLLKNFPLVFKITSNNRIFFLFEIGFTNNIISTCKVVFSKLGSKINEVNSAGVYVSFN